MAFSVHLFYQSIIINFTFLFTMKAELCLIMILKSLSMYEKKYFITHYEKCIYSLPLTTLKRYISEIWHEILESTGKANLSQAISSAIINKNKPIH